MNTIAASGRSPQSGSILLVEDDDGDVLLMKKALQNGRVFNTLDVVADGVEAMAYLRNEGIHADAPRPALILLDLNMPRKDGREALREIKTDPALRSIPVIALTTSEAEEDIHRIYDLGGNSFIVKPAAFDRMVDLVRVLSAYWFDLVELAEPDAGGKP